MDTLGQTLKQAREAKGVALSEAAAATRIKLSQLEDIEGDDYSNVPAPTYAKGFLKIYAQFLGLDPEPVLQRFVAEHANKKAPPPSLKPPKEPRRSLFGAGKSKDPAGKDEEERPAAVEQSPPSAPEQHVAAAPQKSLGEETFAVEEMEPEAVETPAPENDAAPAKPEAVPEVVTMPLGDELPELDPAPEPEPPSPLEPAVKKKARRLTPDFALSDKERKRLEDEVTGDMPEEIGLGDSDAESPRASSKEPKTTEEGPFFGEKPRSSIPAPVRRLLIPGGVAVVTLLLLSMVIHSCQSPPEEAVSFSGVDLPENGLLLEPPEPYLKLE